MKITAIYQIASHLRNPIRHGLLGLMLLAAGSDAASAQSDYPNRPIRIVVPYAAGGSADILARLIAAGLQTSLGQTVLVENRSGASGNVGTVAVAHLPEAYGYRATSEALVNLRDGIARAPMLGARTRAALVAYLWSWTENQVMAAIKCVPLGQTAGQRILLSLGERLEGIADKAATIELSNFVPGLAMLSSRHEKQYSRLFRS